MPLRPLRMRRAPCYSRPLLQAEGAAKMANGDRTSPPLLCTHSHASPGSAPQYPADHPEYRFRPIAHAASSGRRPQVEIRIHRHSDSLPLRTRDLWPGGSNDLSAFFRHWRRPQIASAEKTFQCPEHFLDGQFQADGGIMLQLRVRPFSPGHDRHPARRQQHLAVLQAGGHQGPEVWFGKGPEKRKCWRLLIRRSLGFARDDIGRHRSKHS